jgi:two-component system chemotaxis sensor kinase CheA
LALRQAGRQFDVIVSDIEMPDMSGLDFVRAIRADGAWANLPVIALSGRVSEQDVEIGRDAGFTDYIGKFSKDALLASLHQCLQTQPASAPTLGGALQMVA